MKENPFVRNLNMWSETTRFGQLPRTPSVSGKENRMRPQFGRWSETRHSRPAGRRLSKVPHRREHCEYGEGNGKTDELSAGHSTALHGSRHSRDEQGF